jgi:hypothetical protein
MSEQEKAAELARLRDRLVELESDVAADRREPTAPIRSEGEIARIRARIADLEADLGI